MSQPEIRPATAADLAAYYGEPPRRTMRAWVAVLDGKPIAVAGVAYEAGKPHYLFSEMRPEMKRYRKAILRGGRRVLEDTKGMRLLASCSSPGASRFLVHLGLRFLTDTVDGRMIFEWGGR